MKPFVLFLLRLCLLLAAVGFVIGGALFVIPFMLASPVVIAFRPTALQWLGGYLMAMGIVYVFVSTRAPEGARLAGPNVNVFAGIPDKARGAAYATVIAAFVAFFVAIAFVELHAIDRGVGEVAILGAFCVGAFGAMFCGFWSALKFVAQE